MSAPTTRDQQEQEQEQALQEAIEKALDFSELYADIERIEQMIEEAKK